jgi:HD-GYP domain-containing protein (c-di-GMP phosphodiesterase class II)
MTSTGKETEDPLERARLLEAAQMLLAMLGERGPALKKRSERLGNLCANFGEALGWPPQELLALYLAALLQNIGLVSLPKDRLQMGHVFPEEEIPELKRHPVAGVSILGASPSFERILPAVRHHHEAFDGSGYPDGLAGADIPLHARVIHLCDGFDELTAGADAAPGPGGFGAALEKMRRLGGRRFDPALLAPFARFVETGAEIHEDFQRRHQAAFIRQSLVAILPDIRSGKVVPPAMPRVAWALRRLVQRAQVGLQEVCRIIEREPVISARLVSIANSPVYRGQEEIKNLQAAVPRLGYKEVLSVVVAIAHKNLYDVKQAHFRVLMDKMWVHSVACAFGAKLLAQRLSMPEPETLFLMGLTHDIGKAVLLRAFCERRLEKNLDADALSSAIQDLHLKVGEMLLRRWGLGEEFVRVVALHEHGDYSPDTAKEVLIVHLANHLVRKMGLSLIEWDGTPPAALSSAVMLGATAGILEPLEDALRDIVRDVAHLF